VTTRAALYRREAERLYGIILSTDDEQIQQELLVVARRYESLAVHANERDGTKPAKKPAIRPN
jgi:hypothetical protein